MKINTTTLVSDLSFLQQGYTYGINDSGPWQRFKRRGYNVDIESWYVTLYNAGWIVTVTREVVSSATNNGISTIEASAGWAYPYLYGTETPENIWEIDPEDAQKSLLEADFQFSGTSGLNNVNLTSKLTSNAVAKIVDDDQAFWAPAGSSQNPTGYGIVSGTASIWAFDDGNLNFGTDPKTITTASGVTTVPATETRAVVHLPSADYDAAYSLYLLMRAGNEVFPMEASVIRHSQVTSNLYAVQASYNNMNRLISSPSMYSVEGVPGTLLFAVPSAPSVQQYIETPGDLQYAWRKVRPAVSRLSRLKWRITQNYQFGLWPIRTFGAVL